MQNDILSSTIFVRSALENASSTDKAVLKSILTKQDGVHNFFLDVVEIENGEIPLASSPHLQKIDDIRKNLVHGGEPYATVSAVLYANDITRHDAFNENVLETLDILRAHLVAEAHILRRRYPN